MKNYYSFFALSFLIISFAFLLISCSQESSITAPILNQSEVMAKKTVLPSSTIDFTTDTTIILPKSGKTIIASKKYSAAIISAIDAYLANHTNISYNTSLATNSIVIPNAVCPSCPLQAVRVWVDQWNFEPLNGKKLGVWSNMITLQNQLLYGFNETFISNSQDRDAALQAGFLYNNLLLGIGSQQSYQSQLQDVNTPDAYTPSNFIINRGYIDEPYESNNPNPWSQTDVLTCAAYIANNYSGTLTFSAWQSIDPNIPPTLLALPQNKFVMCDQYEGDVYDFWNFFKNGYMHNVSNWISLEKNANYTGNPGYSTLFGFANSLGYNEMWLFADNWGTLSDFVNFTTSAFNNQWLKQYQLELVL